MKSYCKLIPHGSTWKHHRGAEYMVTNLSNIASSDREKFPVMVTYACSKRLFWSRPADEFLEKFTRVK